jgi:Beta-galactosidase jelly roll domain
LKIFLIFILFVFLNSPDGLAQIINLNGKWKFQIGDIRSWASPDLDDSEWEVIMAPSPWEDEGFNGYDGFAWYRKKFDGRELLREESYIINLGYIDDTDEVYLNGVLIGLSGTMPPKFKTAFNTERKYSIPTEAINYKGENTIAIRVFDVTLGGGIIEGRLGIDRAPKSKMLIDLHGLWSFTTSWDGAPAKNDKEWKKIMVPSSWEIQGYKYDGFAWYKRSFSVSDKIVDIDDDLLLVLGKIDDFDKAYLNGKLIGKTNDGKSFGRSDSYNKLRAYNIPIGILKKGETNTIEVLVEDMGNIGGIYEGPVGITTRTAFERYFR